jgi:ABC-type phosphate/phosphonate transport system permease subunit
VPSLRANKVNFFTSTEFNTADANDLRFGIAELLQVTVLGSVLALVVAVPIAIGIATFLTNDALRAVARPGVGIVALPFGCRQVPTFSAARYRETAGSRGGGWGRHECSERSNAFFL